MVSGYIVHIHTYVVTYVLVQDKLKGQCISGHSPSMETTLTNIQAFSTPSLQYCYRIWLRKKFMYVSYDATITRSSYIIRYSSSATSRASNTQQPRESYCEYRTREFYPREQATPIARYDYSKCYT